MIKRLKRGSGVVRERAALCQAAPAAAVIISNTISK
eukprot:COSAG06_NODE_19937_length_817_cov_0.891365_2_plen_35_part_01